MIGQRQTKMRKAGKVIFSAQDPVTITGTIKANIIWNEA
jgi:hypothetical protein